jgi:hypothetical protein
LLQRGGEVAAQRLLSILQSPSFATMPPASQRAFIDLALTRAYGLPVRRAVNVNLSSSDADAVAASLSDIAQHLPETNRHAQRPQNGPETGGQAVPGYPTRRMS